MKKLVGIESDIISYIDNKRGNLTINEYLRLKLGVGAEQKDYWNLLDREQGEVVKIPFFSDDGRSNIINILSSLSSVRPMRVVVSESFVEVHL